MNERRRRYRLGRLAEAACVWHLRARGYHILATRFRTPAGEIDIVVRRRGIVAFVEVKARRDRATAAESVSPRQRARIRRAAQWYLGARPALAEHGLRFDIMLVTPWNLPYHVTDAWRD